MAYLFTCKCLICFEVTTKVLTRDRMYAHDVQLSKVTAGWLLPGASVIVAAGVGGVVAEVPENPQHALWTVIVSYFLWGTAMPLSVSIMAIYLQRLFIHKLPPREVIVSSLLPVAAPG